MERYVHETEHLLTQMFGLSAGLTVCTLSMKKGSLGKHKVHLLGEICPWISLDFK